MKKFEYLFESITASAASEQKFNELGLQGWAVVDLEKVKVENYTSGTYYLVLFMRERSGDSALEPSPAESASAKSPL